jgi:hypothetical protein
MRSSQAAMEETGGDYRPVSKLAVAALVAGVLAALALVSPICWVIPLVAIGLAVAALADVNRPGANKAGGWAAVAGLALAVGFGAQAVTSSVVSRWLVERRAAAVALHWIDAVRAGRLADAMSVSEPRALPGGEPHAHPGEAAAPAAEHDRAAAFAALAVVRGLQACDAEPPRVTTIEPAAETEGGWVVVAALAPCGRPEESVRLVVAPDRVQRQGGPVERWLVTGFTLER